MIEPLLATCRGDDDSVQEVADDGTAILNVATDNTSEVVAKESMNGPSDLVTREGIEQWVEGVGQDEDSVDQLEGEDDEKTCVEDECVEDEDDLGNC